MIGRDSYYLREYYKEDFENTAYWYCPGTRKEIEIRYPNVIKPNEGIVEKHGDYNQYVEKGIIEQNVTANLRTSESTAKCADSETQYIIINIKHNGQTQENYQIPVTVRYTSRR